jgi:hypothetical protein
MPARDVWDVEPREHAWAVQREGTDRADSVHDTKNDAMDRGRELAKAANGQLRIKGHDGHIQDERTYTNDPYPPRADMRARARHQRRAGRLALPATRTIGRLAVAAMRSPQAGVRASPAKSQGQG